MKNKASSITLKIKLFLILVTIAPTGFHVYGQSVFTIPLDIPVSLSGNFGEMRSTHFHAGIDFRTMGTEGKNVFASFDGFVSRIKIERSGYGKALYLTHPNGYTTVYAHLKEFSPEIEEYVKENQYRQKTHEIELFPPLHLFRFKTGELIGYSGNTGSSSGPHLHFEIRTTSDQRPQNVLRNYLEIRDNIKPEIYSLFVYPIDENSFIDNRNEKKRFGVSRKGDQFTLAETISLRVTGRIGFGIEVYDFINGSTNRCGIYSLQLIKDGEEIYMHEMTQFSFQEARYVNSHTDFEEKIRNRRNVHKMVLQPNNNLSIYKNVQNKGVINFNEDTISQISIITKDANNNESALSFYVHSYANPGIGASIMDKKEYVKIMPYNQDNGYQNNEVKVRIPAFALYDELKFNYVQTSAIQGTLTPVHHIHNIYTALHNRYTLSIRTHNLPPEYKDKASIVMVNDENELNYIGGEYDAGFVTAYPRRFGKYAVAIDTIPPRVAAKNFRRNQNVSGLQRIEFTITDNLSGIDTYNGFINNQWALFEFDPKNDLLFYQFDENRINKGQTHEVKIVVTDHRNNETIYTTSFLW